MRLLVDGGCEFPGCPLPGTLRAQNTAYCRDVSNWHRYCEEHQKEADEHWDEMWREYRASVL